jgi:hypothetical protein
MLKSASKKKDQVLRLNEEIQQLQDSVISLLRNKSDLDVNYNEFFFKKEEITNFYIISDYDTEGLDFVHFFFKKVYIESDKLIR